MFSTTADYMKLKSSDASYGSNPLLTSQTTYNLLFSLRFVPMIINKTNLGKAAASYTH